MLCGGTTGLFAIDIYGKEKYQQISNLAIDDTLCVATHPQWMGYICENKMTVIDWENSQTQASYQVFYIFISFFVFFFVKYTHTHTYTQ